MKRIIGSLATLLAAAAVFFGLKPEGVVTKSHAETGLVISAEAMDCRSERCGGVIDYQSWSDKTKGWENHQIVFEIEEGNITSLSQDELEVVGEHNSPIKSYNISGASSPEMVTMNIVPMERERVGPDMSAPK